MSDNHENVGVPEELVERVDWFVAHNNWGIRSRAEFVRVATQRFIEDMVEIRDAELRWREDAESASGKADEGTEAE